MHRNLLVASSQYFNVIFRNEFIFVDVIGPILQLIVNFCYTGEIEINSNNIESVLYAATKYQFIEIQKICAAVLKRYLQINPKKCLSYFLMACRFQLMDLKELSKRLVLENFMKIKDSGEFLLLSCGILQEFLMSIELVVAREHDVFDAVEKWIAYDRTGREQYVGNLMKCIRFDQIENTVKYFLLSPIIVLTKRNLMHKLPAPQIVHYKSFMNIYVHTWIQPYRVNTLRQTLFTIFLLYVEVDWRQKRHLITQVTFYKPNNNIFYLFQSSL